MPSLWFVMPAHGRLELARICLRQLRRTVDALEHEGIRASAVVIADDENLDTAREQGFAWVRRPNWFTSMKFNDGIEYACREGNVDYVVPIGSDDWVDHRLFLELPPTDRMYAFQRMSFVREDGAELTVRKLNNEGGCGIRIYPRQALAPLGYRPADEDRARACDTSILLNVKKAGALRWIEHRDIDPLQIVDWKTHGQQLNAYCDVAARHRSELTRDPFEALEGRYPGEALDEMAAHYGRVAVAA